MKQKRLWLLMAFLPLIGCSEMKVQREAEEASTATHAFAVTHARAGKIEPCSCQIVNWGGVGREVTFYSQFEKQNPKTKLYRFSSGDTLLDSEVAPKLRVKAAERVVQALNTLQYQAMTLTPFDLKTLGVNETKALAEKAKFTFIATNLRSHPATAFVKPWARLDGIPNGYVVGLSNVDPNSKTWMSPEEGLRKALSSLQPDVFIVVLSDLSREKQIQLQKEFPQIRIWLGTGPSPAKATVREQYTGKSVAVSGFGKGRDVAMMLADFSEGVGGGFYSAEFQRYARSAQEELKQTENRSVSDVSRVEDILSVANFARKIPFRLETTELNE